MIRSITFTSFRSYEAATLKLAPLTLLVGLNASGKSNAREGIQLISWIAQGRRLDEILRSVRERELGVRGRFSDLGFRGADGFGLRVEVQDEQGTSLWNIWLGVDAGGMRVIDESLRLSGEQVPLYELNTVGGGLQHDVAIAYNNFKKGGKKSTIPGTDLVAVLTQINSPAAFRPSHIQAQNVIPAAVQRVRDELGHIVLLDPNPHLMRAESFLEDKVLHPDGGNLSSVLHALCQDDTGRASVLDFIRGLPEQDITDIGFLVGARNQVIVQVHENFFAGGEWRDASLLSDGTLRVLAIAAAVLSAPEGTLVVIEEIDNGVHPSRAQTLLANMHAVATRRSLNLLVTSHNPALADALPDSSIPDVVYCHRNPETGGTELVRLEDLDDYPRLIAQGSLGQLITRSVLERFVKHPQTAEQRRETTAAWFKGLAEDVG